MESSIEIYGNTVIHDDFNEIPNNDSIQLQYYKIHSDISDKYNEKPYGIGVIKTFCNEIELNVEKREFNHIFKEENDADNMLSLLLKNQVTPIELKDILEDFVLV